MKKVDARGRSCPEPVVMTKKALENYEDDLEILVGEEVAKENVSRLIRNYGATVEIKELDDGYKLIVSK